MSQKHWTVTVKEDESGELYIDIPDEILQELGWNETTPLEWEFPPDNKTIILKRAKE